MSPYWHPYTYWFWHYWRFPWPGWWGTGTYRPVAPYIFLPAYAGLPKEQEIAILESQKRLLEEMLSQINKRLEELKKEQSSSTEMD